MNISWLPCLVGGDGDYQQSDFILYLVHNTRGLYYITLRTCNIRQINRFPIELVSFILSDTCTLALKNTLAY
jgi:hypothetical protein